jgi:hypothetical protein
MMMPSPNVAGGIGYVARDVVLDNRWSKTRNLPKTYNEDAQIPVRPWDNKRSRHTTWQKSLTLLKTLKIVISVKHCLHLTTRNALAELPQKADILLRTEKMQVEVRVPKCMERAMEVYASGKPKCDGHCAHVIQQVLESMLQ